MDSVSACARVPAAPSWRAVAARAARACPPDPTAHDDVSRVLDEGTAFHGNRVVVFVAPGTGQVSFVAGRRVGGAVTRNRAKRILRAAWHEVAPGIRPGSDLAFVARGAIRGARSGDVVGEMRELLTRAGLVPR